MIAEGDLPGNGGPRYLHFDEFVVDAVERQLYREGQPLHLTPRAFDLLHFFVRRPTELLTREELLEAVWGDRIVEDANLTQTVFVLRKTLDDDGETRRFIVTEPGRGYRFVREVVAREEAATTPPAEGDSRGHIADPVAARRSAAVWAFGAALGLLALFLLVTAGREDEETSVEYSSVAVLPFVDLATNEPSPLGLALADGVSGQLASELPALDVRRSSALIDYVNGRSRPEEIGEALGVEALIHGSVIRLEGTLHAAVALTGTRDGETVWAASFEGPDGDVFALQESIAAGAYRAISSEADRFAPALSEDVRGTESAAAYERRMEGEFQLSKRSAEGTELARVAFDRALEIDPGYAEAWAELATSELLLVFYGTGSSTAGEHCERARSAALRALELRPELAEPNTTLAMIELHCRHQYERAEERFRRAIELDPSSARAHHWYSLFASATGDHRHAAELLEQAHRLDPMSLIIRSSMAADAYARGRSDEALRLTYSTLAIDPHFGRAHLLRGLVLEQLGRYEEAEASLSTAREILGPNDEVRAARIHLELQRGGTLPEIEESTVGIRSPMHRAVAVAPRDRERAVDLLLEAVEQRELWIWQLWTDPRLDAVRAHPEFARVEEALGLRFVPMSAGEVEPRGAFQESGSE